MRDLTKEEHEILDHLGKAYIKFNVLEPAHPYDIGEFVTHIHTAQNIVLARPGTEVIQDYFEKHNEIET